MIDVSISWDGARALGAVYLIQFVGFTVLAWFARGREALDWSPELVRSARVNWAFIAFNALAAPLALLMIGWAEAAYSVLPVPSIPQSAWDGLPMIVPALIAVVAIDFVDYWSHRIRHAPLFWPIHAVHHSDTQLHYLSWYRGHILEHVFAQAVYIFAASWLGADATAIVAIVMLKALHQQYVHMDIDWTHGRLGWLIASPRFHRWHHADHPEAYGKNLAFIMPLWDRLFGTYYCPGPCREPLGFPGSPGDNFLGLMVFPFLEWGRMARRAVSNPRTPADTGA